ncbi:hypothetical protein [Streptomyces adustus]|uniref:hypothetical protein n=1 Tax=Streptomyces adustus TaxID=1609272 RepID=UPI00139190EA|nr:hypothetical protein [Streptomyces adustus]
MRVSIVDDEPHPAEATREGLRPAAIAAGRPGDRNRPRDKTWRTRGSGAGADRG